MPKLSIITVTLNNALGLRETIENVISQTYSDYEYIIIDGGSTDGSVEVIKRYANKIFYWVSESDKGIYHAMNKGIAKSNAEWVLFMNCGDMFANSEVLKNVFNSKIESQAKVLYGNVLVKGSNAIVYPSALSKSFFLFATICHQSLFTKRELFSRYGNFNLSYSIASDKEWLLRIFLAKNHFSYIDLDICAWDPVGVSSENIDLFTKETKEIEKLYFSFFEILLFRIVKFWQNRWLYFYRNFKNEA